MSAIPILAKTCPACGETRPLQQFRRSADRLDGHTRKCSPCFAAQRIERLEAMPPLDRATLPDEKRCCGCLVMKPNDAFHLNGRKGLASRCRDCLNQADRARYAKKAALPVRLRMLQGGNSALDAQEDSERRARALGTMTLCVCGALRSCHARGGVGGNAATGCPGFFERGA